MRLKKIAATAALALAATGTATLVTGTSAHAEAYSSYGTIRGYYSTWAACQDAGVAGIQAGDWRGFICNPVGGNWPGYLLYSVW